MYFIQVSNDVKRPANFTYIGNSLGTKGKIENLASIYYEVKQHQSMKVIFVQFLGITPPEILSKMPWYVCPEGGTNSAKLRELVDFSRMKRDPTILIGFGEDGRVSSYLTDIGSFSQRFINIGKVRLGSLLVDGDDDGHDLLYADVKELLGYDSYYITRPPMRRNQESNNHSDSE